MAINQRGKSLHKLGKECLINHHQAMGQIQQEVNMKMRTYPSLIILMGERAKMEEVCQATTITMGKKSQIKIESITGTSTLAEEQAKGGRRATKRMKEERGVEIN